MQVKRCTKCGEVKPLDRYVKQAAGKYGVTSRCKDCDRAYREANREALRAWNAEYRAANREHARQKSIEWRKANPGRSQAACARYYAANREQILRMNAAYYVALPAEYRSALERTKKGARRARETAGGCVPVAVLASVLAESSCVYCGAVAQEVDHVRPLLRGGLHDESNLVPSCRECNRGRGGKFSKLLIEWDSTRVERAASVSVKVAAELARELEGA